MLGFSPVSSRSISGGAFSLAAVAASMAASVAVAFSGSANPGLFTPMSASAAVSFAIDATWITHQAIGSTVSLTFNGIPTLRVAGKPIRIVALPQSYALRALPGNFDLTALSQSFTLRGYR